MAIYIEFVDNSEQPQKYPGNLEGSKQPCNDSQRRRGSSYLSLNYSEWVILLLSQHSQCFYNYICVIFCTKSLCLMKHFCSVMSGNIINFFTFLYLLPSTETSIFDGAPNFLLTCQCTVLIYMDDKRSKKVKDLKRLVGNDLGCSHWGQ